MPIGTKLIEGAFQGDSNRFLCEYPDDWIARVDYGAVFTDGKFAYYPYMGLVLGIERAKLPKDNPAALI